VDPRYFLMAFSITGVISENDSVLNVTTSMSLRHDGDPHATEPQITATPLENGGSRETWFASDEMSLGKTGWCVTRSWYS
jgi:hypothetical protein